MKTSCGRLEEVGWFVLTLSQVSVTEVQGELGLAYKTQTSYPDQITKVPKLKWKQIACGAEHTLALTGSCEG